MKGKACYVLSCFPGFDELPGRYSGGLALAPSLGLCLSVCIYQLPDAPRSEVQPLCKLYSEGQCGNEGAKVS